MADNNEYDALVQPAPPEGGDQVNEYYSMVDPAKAEQKSAVQQSLLVAADQNPDQMARVIKLAKQTNLPTGVVARNYDEVAKRTMVAHTDYDKLIDETPTTANWLAQPNNAALAKDDVDNLAASERAIRDHSFGHSLYSSLMSGVAGLWGSVARTPGLLYDTFALPQNLMADATGHPEWKTSASQLPFDNRVAQYFEGAQKDYAAQAPELSQSIVDAASKGDYAAAGKALAAQFVASAPTQAAVIASAMMGAPAVGIAGIGLTSAAETNQRGSEQGADPASNTLNALSHGVIQAASAEVGTLGPLKAWEATLAKSFGREASSGIITNMLSTLGLATTRGAASMGVASAASDVSDYLTGVNPDAIHGIVKRAADSAIVGAASDVGLTGTMALGHHVISSYMGERIGQNAATYQQLGDFAKNSKLNGRSPEAYQEFISQATQGQAAQNVYIRPEALETYFQSKNIDPAQAAKELDLDPKKLAAAIETGSYLEIPLPKWLSKLGNTEHYQALANDVTLSPEVPSVNEAKTISADAKARVDEAVAKAKEQTPVDPAAQAAPGSVFSKISDQLKAAGHSEDTAKQYAAIYDKAFTTLGNRAGVDPQELFNRYGLTIGTGSSEFMQPEAHVLEQAARVGDTNVVDAIQEFKNRAKEAGNKTPNTKALREQKATLEDASTRKVGDHSEKLDSIVARYPEGSEEHQKARDAVDKAQNPKKGPYVPSKDIASGWSPNFSAEPTGTIGKDEIHHQTIVKGVRVGETDPLAWSDSKYGATKKLIEEHAKSGKPLTINTSSDLVGRHDYISAMPKDTTVRMHLLTNDEDLNRKLFPGNPSRGRQDSAVEHLKESGVKVEAVQPTAEDVIKSAGGEARVARELGIDKADVKLVVENAIAPSLVDASNKFAERRNEAATQDTAQKAQDVADAWTPGTSVSNEQLRSIDRRIDDIKHEMKSIGDTDPDRHEELQNELSKYIDLLEKSGSVAKRNEIGLRAVTSLEQGGKDEPRGRIRFGDNRQFSIDLLKGADLSTFLHETGHFYLEVMHDLGAAENAPADIKDDLATVRKWLGAEDGAKLTVEQHEQFARGFEAYLMEGKAPSGALKEAFDRFRSWLVDIYKKVRNLNVELTPDVRAVFDRMLATDTEIKAAREDIGQTKLQDTVPDLPPDLVGKLEKLQERAHNEAVDHLLDRQMEEIRAHHKEFLEKRRSELQEKVAAKIKDEPLYRAEEELKKQIQNTPRRRLADDFINGRLSDENRDLFNVIAEMQGYSSGDELAKAIMDSTSMKEAVKKRVASEMQVYSDLKNTGAIRDEALKAIHNERSLELMSLEHEILEGLVKDAAIKEEAKRRKYAEAKIESKAIKDRAKDLMWDLNIRGATAFGPILTDERRAATSLGKALAAKDYERAGALKRQQMLNHALATESLRIGKKVDGWTDFLNGLRTKDPGAFRKEEHFYQIAEILSRLGFGRTDYDPRKRRDTLAQWAQKVQEQTNTLNIPDWVFDESRIKNYQQLTVSQLQDVVNTLKNIQRVASFENRALAIDKGATLDDIKQKLTISATTGARGRESQKPTMEPGRFDSVKSLGSKYLLSLTKIQTLLRDLQGWRDEGDWTRTFWDPVYHAANHESELMQWANDGLKKAFDGYTMADRKKLMNDQVFHPELGTSATKMRLLMMALNIGNEDNRQKLFNTKPVGVEGALAWNEHTVMDLLQKNLGEKDWKFVQGIWDLLNERWGDISALHKELTGFTPEKVEARPFNVTLPDGKIVTMDGGYFPLKEDPRASVRAATRESLEAPLYTEQNPGWSASTSTGHTKARSGAQYSVSLDNTIIYKHLRDVIHDIAFRKVVTDLRRLVTDKELHGVIQDRVGIEGHAMLREWVGSVAQGNTNNLDAFERIVQSLMRRTTTAVCVAKASLLTQHLAHAFLFSGAHEDFTQSDATHALVVRGAGDYWRKALTDRKGYKDTRDFVFSRSRFMVDKHANPDMSFWETHAEAFGEDSKMKDFAKGLLGSSDELTSIPMWIEAYSKGLDKHMEEDEAIKYADTLIDRTIGSGRKYDAAPIQRAGMVAKSLSMFYTFLNSEYNRWRTEFGRAQVDPAHVSKFLGFALGRLLVFQTATLLLAGKGPHEDEDKTKWWLKNTLKYPMDLLPGVREIGDIALDEALGLKSYGYTASPASEAVEQMVLNPIKTASSVAKGDAEPAQILEQLSKSAAYIFPYPDQFNAWFWNAHDALFNHMTPKPGDLYHRRAKADR